MLLRSQDGSPIWKNNYMKQGAEGIRQNIYTIRNSSIVAVLQTPYPTKPLYNNTRKKHSAQRGQIWNLILPLRSYMEGCFGKQT